MSLFTVRHVFVGFVEGANLESRIRNPEFGMRNAEFATLFLLLFVDNHFAFTIFFCFSFFKNYRMLSRKSQKKINETDETAVAIEISTTMKSQTFPINILPSFTRLTEM